MKVSVEEMLKADDQPRQGSGERKNLFFSLKGEGDSAIVRFLFEDINDFEVLDVHNIQLGGYNRKINCLRTQNGSKNECEFCKCNVYDEEKRKSTYPLQRKFFIHLLRYNNAQEAEEQIWERSKDYIRKLNQLVEDYGPLCDRLYKIVRHGAEGSMDTTYDILPLDKDRFNPDNFVFDRSQLAYKPALGTVVLDKTNEEIKEYMTTGNFPGFKDNSNVTSRPAPQPATQPSPVQTETQPNVNTMNSFTSDQPRRRI